MDYLRSAYSTTCHAFDVVTGLPEPFTIRWYRAPAGAQVLPVRHQYGSYNWEDRLPYAEAVGEEIGQPRPYDKGATPPGVLGVDYCGTEWTGMLDRLPVPRQSNKWDQPICCSDPTYCAPAFPLFNCRVQLQPGGPILLFQPRGSSHQTVQDPTYGFWWVLQVQAQACAGYPEAMALSWSNVPSGAPALVELVPLAGNTGPQASWYVPRTAPHYGGATVQTAWSDA